MRIVDTIDEVRRQVREWRAQGLTVGLVPTMGYLHEGHASLIDASHRDNDRTVVSDFVNPMQFGPTEDLESYPRDIDHDAKLVEAHGGDLIFHPDPSEMYHEGFSSFVLIIAVWNRVSNFRDAYLQSLLFLEVMNVYDGVVIDKFWVGHSKFWVLKGTEDIPFVQTWGQVLKKRSFLAVIWIAGAAISAVLVILLSNLI